MVDMASSPALTVPHTASTVSIVLSAYGSGWQGLADEAWGVDAFSITDQPVPGPLPALGAASAFPFSRKLRRRLALSAHQQQP